ncbi:stemmadenine O-acetyltransferase-like [Mercurialis annua]|uniref:stemmadenine O-acetyltransferase-like n=1 Tax=Mercurialis annua TaxID=3986 RepID=UPI002160EA5B|nr:stemmadenine O-acetyltransferase-like [Mercurialis annua]
MEVQFISKQNVRPSSPTPPHLRIFKLSILDQLIPSAYAPIVLFYSVNTNTKVLERLSLLKSSLSETLTRFYPLAGKIINDLSINCNDEGANFVETRVSCCLDEFLTEPVDLHFINKLLPCQFITEGSMEGTYVTNVQANVFECGGIAIGICISHKILDGAALSTFLKGWTSTAQGCRKVVFPKFTGAALFPANDLWLKDSSMAMWGSMFRKGNCITRRFVFDASAISKLKAQTTSSGGLSMPTRVEAVSALLWKSIIAASAELHGLPRKSLLTHVVNLRTRLEPSLSENSLGNFLWLADAEFTGESTSEPEFNELLRKVREAISRIDHKFVEQIKGDEGVNCLMAESIKQIGEKCSKDEVDCVGFSSWCKLGYYDADFGWGKPVWVSSIGLSGSIVLNLVILVDTRSGDGVEAWVSLDEQVMAILASNPDLLKLASMDPSPLVIY